MNRFHLVTSRRHRATASATRRTRRGFSLVELMVAMVLLAIGVLGLAGVSAYAVRQTNTAQARNAATLIAESRMEELRSRTCANVTAGTRTLPNGIVESWNVAAINSTTRSVTGRVIFTRRSGRIARPDTIFTQTTILCN